MERLRGNFCEKNHLLLRLMGVLLLLLQLLLLHLLQNLVIEGFFDRGWLFGHILQEKMIE